MKEEHPNLRRAYYADEEDIKVLTLASPGLYALVNDENRATPIAFVPGLGYVLDLSNFRTEKIARFLDRELAVVAAKALGAGADLLVVPDGVRRRDS